MEKVKTAKQLGEQLRANADAIEITGDLAKRVIRIRATGRVAWVIAFGAIGVAVVAVLAAPAPPAELPALALNFVAAPAAVSILGVSATVAALSIAVGARSMAALRKLRQYKETSRTAESLVLARR